MHHYAITDAEGWIVAVCAQESADELPDLPGAQPIPTWQGWVAPSPGLRPRLLHGELVWSDPRSLAEIKALKNAKINEARRAANRAGFLFQGKLIASDELSRGDIDAVQAVVARTQALPPGWPGGWKAVDNTVLPILDVATWDAFYAAMYAAGLANFAKAQALKAQLAAATTPEQVAAIAW